MASVPPSPLPQTSKSGVHLDEQGQWSYLGTPMVNPEINALFTQGLREDPDLGFYVQIFGQNAAITVDRTAWLIVHSHYSSALVRHRVLLLSGDEDDLDPATPLTSNVIIELAATVEPRHNDGMQFRQCEVRWSRSCWTCS